MSFFNEFSLRWYDFNSLSNEKVQLITNLLHSISITVPQSMISSMTERYYILDGDTIYSISNARYSHPDYWWIIAILNNQFLSKNNWPLSQNAFEDWIDQKYIGIEPRSKIKCYEKEDGTQTTLKSIRYFYGLGDNWTDLEIIQRFNINAISIYEWEKRENEKRKYIRLPKDEYIQQIDREFKAKMLDLARTYN